jgi:predicted nucleic acid-binding Zn ribbon protein
VKKKIVLEALMVTENWKCPICKAFNSSRMKSCWQCGSPRIAAEGKSELSSNLTLFNELPREYKKCPFCAEWILIDAVKCKHCGEFLNNGRERSQPNEMLQDIRAGADKTASELAIIRLKNEITALENEIVRIEAPYRKKIKQYYSSAVFLAVCFVIMLLFGLVGSGSSSSDLCWGYTAFLGGMSVLSYIIGALREGRLPYAEVGPIQALISEKWSELKRHEEIVNR